MCNTVVKARIDDAVAQKIANEIAFTAWDITSAVRQVVEPDGSQPVIFHAEVKAELTRMFHAGDIFGYTREIGSGYPTDKQPMVYKPTSADPEDDDDDDTVYGDADAVQVYPIIKDQAELDDMVQTHGLTLCPKPEADQEVQA